MTTNLLIIGGSDAGISAGVRARELDPGCEVTIAVSDRFPNYSICGLPFYLSGEVADWHWLAYRTAEDIAREGIHLLQDSAAQSIDPTNHLVTLLDDAGKTRHLPYDRLIIATGAVPVRPRILGIDLPGVFLLRRVQDSFAVHEYLDTDAPRSAVIVGAGYIGVEMADAFVRRGLAVTLDEHGTSVLKTVDESLGKLVSAELRRRGVEVETGIAVERIEQAGSQLHVRGSDGFGATADLVLIAVSVRPQTDGGHREFVGTLGTQVVKVFDLAVARTGLRDIEAREAGFDSLTFETTVWDHKVYYPGAHEIRIRLTGDRKTGRLLGAQMVGHFQSEVAKRIDIFATALFHGMRVEELNDLDLSYTPPLSSPWDPVQMSAQAWMMQRLLSSNT